jgi:flagellar hook protein FlgE
VNGADAGAAGAKLATAGATATQAGEIKQGTLELSNVDLTQQFSDLILAQRAFQAGSRIITVSDSVMEEIINLKR